MGQADNLAYTFLDCGMSMSLLESQGSLYENIIGRNKYFIEKIFPEVQELFSPHLDGTTPEELYRAVNKVEGAFIRMDSDELTHNIHHLIRYELEKDLINKNLDVKDLRDAWNQKYKDYLGLEVPDDINGVLQDIHWPFGAIGYFPAYVIGNVISAQNLVKLDEDINLNACIQEGNFKLINLWNKEHIWKFGGMYSTKEILEDQLVATFDSGPYIDYLKNKFSEIYNL